MECIKILGPGKLLPAGNGRVVLDWDTGGRMAKICWFSKKIMRLVYYGDFRLSFFEDGREITPREYVSFYEDDVIPHTIFRFADFDVEATVLCPVGRDAFFVNLEPRGGGKDLSGITAVLDGKICFGQESRFMKSVGRGREINGRPYAGTGLGLPAVKLDFNGEAGALAAANTNLNIYSRFAAGGVRENFVVEKTTRHDDLFDREDDMVRLSCSLPLDRQSVVISCHFADEPVTDETGDFGRLLEETKSYWHDLLKPLATLSMPDKKLERAFVRGLLYPLTCCNFEVEDMCVTTPAHGALDAVWLRDAFISLNPLLMIRPDLMRKHLNWYFKKGIKTAVGSWSYYADGVLAEYYKNPDGSRISFQLDQAVFPLIGLYRYWLFTLDKDYLRQKHVKDGVEKTLSMLDSVRHPGLGLFASEMRPSDDVCVYPYLIPSNGLACMALGNTAALYRKVYKDEKRAGELEKTAEQIKTGIFTHAVIEDEKYGKMFAYEIDGHGKYLKYEDACPPNLAELPHWGFCGPDDPVYLNTIRFGFSADNPGYVKDNYGGGLGSVHNRHEGFVNPWPLGAMAEILAHRNDGKFVSEKLEWLKKIMTPCFGWQEQADPRSGWLAQNGAFLAQWLFLETFCGLDLEKMTVNPRSPAGWNFYSSPWLAAAGRKFRIEIKNGKGKILYLKHLVPR